MAIKIAGTTVIDDSKNFIVGGTILLNDSTGTAGQVIQSTGTGVTWGTAPSSSVVTAIKTTDYTAVANDLVRTNTTDAGFSVTLPPSPVDGTVVSIMDTYSKFGTNALTVLPSVGTTVVADATSLVLDVNGTFITLIYSSANTDWGLEQTPSSIASLPVQTGNAGKSLTTDGTTASWTDVASGSGATIIDDDTTSTTQYLGMSRSTSGAWTSAYTASTKLYFNPSTGILAATIFQSLSDETQKTDIVEIADAVATVSKLEGVEFNWIDNNKKSAGVIAQQLESILPHLVETNDLGLKSVNYSGIIGYLIEAVKELSDRVIELEAK